MKRVLLTMASVMMLVSMTFAQDETPMLPESHGATDNQPAWGSFQNFNLVSGWNWWSTYINVTDIAQLENALGDKAIQIKLANDYVEYNGTAWVGALSSIDLSKMYLINMDESAEVSLRGTRAAADQVAIEVNPGWNWVGYPVSFNTPVAYALAGYTAAVEDAFKGQNGFVEYNGTTWVGSLTELEPGIGYRLNSNNTAAVSFTYPAVPAAGKGMLTAEYDNATEWQPEKASNPYNMTMVAVINLDGKELRSDNVEVGVFNGETCRGAVRAMYVESSDQYLAFLTMYGEENEPYSFRLLDHETGAVYHSNEAAVSFHADAMIGKLRNPFELNFNTKANVANSLQLFPNPVNRGEMVNMTLPSEGTMTVEVINMLGSTMKSLRVAQGSNEISADMAPGIYTVKATDAQGKVYVDKLVVK